SRLAMRTPELWGGNNVRHASRLGRVRGRQAWLAILLLTACEQQAAPRSPQTAQPSRPRAAEETTREASASVSATPPSQRDGARQRELIRDARTAAEAQAWIDAAIRFDRAVAIAEDPALLCETGYA